MSMPVALPFGIRDIKLIPYTDLTATVLEDTAVDLPYARTLSFTETEDFEDLRGDDTLVTSHGSGANVEWEIESGGISIEAWGIMSGGAVTVSGTGLTLKRSYRKLTTDQKPWFRIEGQAISDSGGDLHTIIYRARVTDSLEGEFTDEEFFLTSGSGMGFGSWVVGEEGWLYDFVQNAAITPIVTDYSTGA